MKKRNMKKDLFKNCKNSKIESGKYNSAYQGGCAYFFAFIGASIYFIQNATTFWGGVGGVIKALFWPAVLIYKLLGFLA
jgi:hypothetical protein